MKYGPGRGPSPVLARAMNRYDERHPGLMLRTRASGRQSYYFVYNHRGRTRWYRIGPSQIGLTKARKIAAELRHAVVDGKDPQAEKLAQRTVGTFGELYERYLEEWAKRERKAWRQPYGLVTKHLLPRWEKLDAKSITRANVRAALGKIDKDSVRRQV